MSQNMKRSVVLIPSLEPDERLTVYVRELNRYEMFHIVVVDDGSGKEYSHIFRELEREGCTVLHHGENQGKGCALKTGYQYIKENLSGCRSVITADSDGQHMAEDVYRLAMASGDQPDGLWLGVRDFKKAGVPPKSLIGNRITSLVFAGLYGKYIPDTQTGLRAFGPKLMDQMLDIKGDRFEYETQVLISCIRSKVPVRTIPIETVYEKENEGTHFHALWDSLSVMKVVVSGFMKFFSVSLVSTVIDMAVAWVLFDLLRTVMEGQDFLRIMVATAAARCMSMSFNYAMNKNFVFQQGRAKGHGLARYLVLSGVNMLLSAAGVYMLHQLLGLDEKLVKMVCDACLFIFSYHIQQRWVFCL